LFAQATAQQTPAPSVTGVAAEWDVRKQIGGLVAGIREMDALLRKADTKIFAENGAPETYIALLRSAHGSMQHLINAANALAQDPEKLSAALETYFQMERLQVLLGSLQEGIRKYQSPDLANMLGKVQSGNIVNKDRLQQQIRDIADLREQEFQIANEEAQRCRANLTKQTSTASQTPRPRTTTNQSSPSTTRERTGESNPPRK